MSKFCVWSLYVCALLCVLSSFVIIPLWKRELVDRLLLSSKCYVAVFVLCPFLMVPWVGMWCVNLSFSEPPF